MTRRRRKRRKGSTRVALGLLVGLVMGACAPASEPAAQAPSPEAAERLERKPPPKNVEIKNLCAEGVPVYVGEQPNGTTGDFHTLRGGGTSHLPRNADGELTLWIVDDKGFGKAHVKVTKRMGKVEIGASCSTLHAE